jgi:hypothetical protein
MSRDDGGQSLVASGRGQNAPQGPARR